jgi:hypothetical protein
MQVWARSAGGTTWEVWKDSSDFQVTAGQARVLSFRVAPSSSTSSGGASLGSAVSVSALASAGATGRVEYQFWRLNTGTRVWSLDRPWSTNSSYAWTPSVGDEGVHIFQVWVRDGSTDWQDWSNAELLVSNLRVTGFTATATTVADGSPMTFVVNAAGSVTGQYEYKFWRYNVNTGRWVVLRDYATSNTFTWVPTSLDVGTNTIQVWVRTAGLPAVYAAWSAMSIRVTPP